MHLDEERIERLRDGELAPAERADAERHLDECATCRDAYARARAEDARVAALLRALDAAARPTVRRRPLRPRRIAIAAAFLVAIVGVAAGLPGSPLASWWRSWTGGTGREAATPAPGPQPDAGATPAPGDGGIALDPGPRLVIDFPAGAPGGHAVVTLVSAGPVVVHAAPDAARFESAEGRLTVHPVGPGAEIRIDVPAGAPEVEIRSGGSRVWRLRAGHVDLALPADSLGSWVIPLDG